MKLMVRLNWQTLGRSEKMSLFLLLFALFSIPLTVGAALLVTRILPRAADIGQISKTANLAPLADTYISAADPTKPFGNETSLKLSLYGTTQYRRALIKFDLTGIPKEAQINRAVLTLNFIGSVTPGKTIDYYQVFDNWEENQATWEKATDNTAWNSPGCWDQADINFGAKYSFTPKTGKNEINLKNLVALWKDLPNLNFGILLNSNISGVAFTIASKEETNSVLRPKLVIDYTLPPPPTSTPTPPEPVPTGLPIIFNQSGLFNGQNSYVKIPTQSRLLPTNGDFTIEAFIKPYGLPNIGFVQKILFQDISNTLDYQYQVYLTPNNDNSGPLYFGLSGFGQNQAVSLKSQTSLENHRLYHFAIVKKGLNLAMYLNGRLESETTLAGQPSIASGPQMFIGVNENGNEDLYHGELDEVRLSNTARYESNFTFPATPFNTDSSTVNLWHFDKNLLDGIQSLTGLYYGQFMYVDDKGTYPPAPETETCPTPNLVIGCYTQYYGEITIDGQPAPVGTQIRFYSPRNELVGCQTVANIGIMRFTPVYSSNATFSGMKENEAVTVKVNSQISLTDPSPLIWQCTNGALRHIKISSGITPTATLAPTATPTPTPPTCRITSLECQSYYNNLKSLHWTAQAVEESKQFVVKHGDTSAYINSGPNIDTMTIGTTDTHFQVGCAVIGNTAVREYGFAEVTCP